MMVLSKKSAEGNCSMSVYVGLRVLSEMTRQQTCLKACGLSSRVIFLQSDVAFFFMIWRWNRGCRDVCSDCAML